MKQSQADGRPTVDYLQTIQSNTSARADRHSVLRHFLHGESTTGNARETFFVWLIGLPNDLQPATAAQSVLDAYTDELSDTDSASTQELHSLLQQTIRLEGKRPVRTRRRTRRQKITYYQ